jgi:hypothetical protein
MRIIFNKMKKDYYLQPLEDHLKTDIRDFQIEDGAEHLGAPWDAMRAYQDRLVSPEYGEEFFKRGAALMQFVGQNYLFRKDAASELRKFYKWMGSYELTAKEWERIKLHPQNVTAYARQGAPA